jgi:hypothetical protein
VVFYNQCHCSGTSSSLDCSGTATFASTVNCNMCGAVSRINSGMVSGIVNSIVSGILVELVQL